MFIARPRSPARPEVMNFYIPRLENSLPGLAEARWFDPRALAREATEPRADRDRDAAKTEEVSER